MLFDVALGKRKKVKKSNAKHSKENKAENEGEDRLATHKLIPVYA
jgi:hypothetical protein